jgi:predicted nucleic acid-binding protein
MIVVDASLTLLATLPGPLQTRALNVFEGWIDGEESLIAPALWVAECASGIRIAVYRGDITEVEAVEILRELEHLTVAVQPMDLPLCGSALLWAGRLRQARAYDGMYLALAERMSAECWTHDRRLANGAKQLGLDWVKTI